MVLPDLLKSNLNIVFCGTAASKKSKKLNAYYAGPGNKFWKTLYEIGLTDIQVNPQEFKILLKYNTGGKRSKSDVSNHAIMIQRFKNM